MKKEDCKEGAAVSWVRTLAKGSGYEMKTIEGKVVKLEAGGAWCQMRNGHSRFKKYEDIEATGQGRDLRQFLRAGGMDHILPADEAARELAGPRFPTLQDGTDPDV